MQAFGEAIMLSPKQCQTLEHYTRRQSESHEWKSQRLGRITASKCVTVNNKVVEIMKNRNARTTSLVENLMTEGPSLAHIPAICWGRTHEQDALTCFLSQEAQNHNKFSLNPAGLFVKDSHPYIAATPDSIAKCQCHGSAPVECKCPFSIRGELTQENFYKTDFLEQIQPSGDIRLKRSHAYYFQLAISVLSPST